MRLTPEKCWLLRLIRHVCVLSCKLRAFACCVPYMCICNIWFTGDTRVPLSYVGKERERDKERKREEGRERKRERGREREKVKERERKKERECEKESVCFLLSFLIYYFLSCQSELSEVIWPKSGEFPYYI